MFCFACAVKLRPTLIVAAAIRCVERNLSTSRPFLAGGHLRNLNTRDWSAAATQVQGIKKRVQRRKPISVEDAGQLPGVSSAITNTRRSRHRVRPNSHIITLYLRWFPVFRKSVIVHFWCVSLRSSNWGQGIWMIRNYICDIRSIHRFFYWGDMKMY